MPSRSDAALFRLSLVPAAGVRLLFFSTPRSLVYNTVSAHLEKNTFLWPACALSTPAPPLTCGRREFVPCTVLQGVGTGLPLARSFPVESQTLIPKLTFLCHFSPLPLGFWCPILHALGANPWVTGGKRARKTSCPALFFHGDGLQGPEPLTASFRTL